jgi:hypothetical protein
MAEAMAEQARKCADGVAQTALRFLRELLVSYHPRDFAIELWDVTVWGPERRQFRRFTWKLNDLQGAATARRLVLKVAGP